MKIDADNIYVAVDYLHGLEYMEYNYCIIECDILDGFSIKQIEKRTVNDYCSLLNIDSTNSSCINLSKLQKSKIDKLTITVEISKISQFDKKLDLKLLSIFECPVCSEFMLPPIHTCITGHSICKICRFKLQKCPTCSACYVEIIRNYSLESISVNTIYPCKNRDIGCNVVLPGSEIEQHESKCQKCPITPNDCILKHRNETEFIQHFINVHKMKESTTINLTDAIYVIEVFFRTQIFHSFIDQITLAFNHIFVLKLRKASADKLQWCCSFISENVKGEFMFEIAYKNDKQKTEMITRSSCLNSVNRTRSISFDTKILNLNQEINIVCRIKKV